MFISLPTPPKEWDSTHRQELQVFLQSATGKLAVEWMMYLAPSLLDGADVNKTLVASGEVKGYGSALQTLFGLLIEKPKDEEKKPTNYPDLDDDSAFRPEENERPL